MTFLATALVILTVLAATTCMNSVLLQVVYSWPAGTTEADKTAILSARTMDDLSTEQYGIAIDRADEIFDYFSPDRQEYKDLLDCGYVDREAFQVLQCWEDKGHTVK